MTARLLSDYLREIDRGALHGELSARMQELIQAIADTGKKGSITLRLDITPSSKIDSDTVTVVSNVKVALPQPDRRATLYFVTDEANLSRRDPRQGDIEDHLAVVDGGRQANGD